MTTPTPTCITRVDHIQRDDNCYHGGFQHEYGTGPCLAAGCPCGVFTSSAGKCEDCRHGEHAAYACGVTVDVSRDAGNGIIEDGEGPCACSVGPDA